MSKLNSEGTFMEKPSSIWITICIVIVGFAVALATLQGGRQVNAANIADLKANFNTIDQKLDQLNDKLTDNAVSQAEMRTDIDYIKDAIAKLQ